MNVDGSDLTRLTHNTGRFPHWSPDGRRIAFSSRRDGNNEIYVMNADGSGQTRLTDHEAYDVYPHWSPDGRRIGFISRGRTSGENNHIYVMNADGSGVTRLMDTQSGSYMPFISWSPDGQRIASSSSGSGSSSDSGEIYVMNADGSGATRLTYNDARDWGPRWSPDGRRIAFSSRTDGNPDTYVMNADGSGVTRLTDGGSLFVSWLSDSQRIAVSVRGGDWAGDLDGNYEIYVANADGSGVTRLTDNDAYDISRSRRIVFDWNYEIYVVNADGSGVTRLTDNDAYDWLPSWSPVGGEAAAPASDQPPFEMEWQTSASEVEAGGELILTVRMHGVRQPGEHGGISVSFPSLTEPGGSKEWYSSSLAEVEAVHYTSGTSSVTFHQPGASIYHRDGNRQFPAGYLLVESDDPTWSRSDDRVLMLRITPRRGGELPIQVRGWLCRDEYTNCARNPASGTATDQQGWFVEVETVRVTAAE